MSSTTLLITFGCSWTYGVGSHWQPGMSGDDYIKGHQDPNHCDTKSWRSVLVSRHGLAHANFSCAGSSNVRQFRRAKHYFGSEHFSRTRDRFQRVIVLWGLTSTARNEIFCLKENNWLNFVYGEADPYSKWFTINSYDHEHEQSVLANEMRHWDQFFHLMEIENYWFDTLNTHDYRAIPRRSADYDRELYESVRDWDWPKYEQAPQALTQQVLAPRPALAQNFLYHDQTVRDQLSWLAARHGLSDTDRSYHLSSWSDDSPRVSHLVRLGLLNPISFHPTQHAHQELAEFFYPSIDFDR